MIKLSGKQKGIATVILALTAVVLGVWIFSGLIQGSPRAIAACESQEGKAWDHSINACIDEELITTIPRLNEIEICESMEGKIWDFYDGVCMNEEDYVSHLTHTLTTIPLTEEVEEFQLSSLIFPAILSISIVVVAVKIKNRKKVI